MLYSSASLLALIIHFIINHDVLRKDSGKNLIPALRPYRAFLCSITVYYVTDLLWGLLYERGLIALTFADTAAYFLAMALSIFYWTRYVIEYLKERNGFGRLLSLMGRLLFGFQVLMVVANFFVPLLYFFDEGGVYHAGSARYITLIVQVAMFLMTAVYALSAAARSAGTMRHRNLAIGLFSLAMGGFVAAQVRFPLLPLYAIGCMLGTCLLHSFVLENEKEDYRDKLEHSLRENILKGNYYDLLTGLPGMSYFFDLIEAKRAALVRRGGRAAFLYLNLRGLKFYNREHGFAAGDRLLRAFAELLVSTFGNQCSRFGQDHFVVYTEDENLSETLSRLFEAWRSPGKRPEILVGVYPDDGSLPVSSACDLAKLACDAIESTHTSTVQYYDAAMLERAEHEQYITAHIDQAIAEGWIQVYFQPIVRVSNGRVCDEEALARWIDPVKGFLSPADFIPILEDARLIYKLDLHVVDEVLKKLKRQRDEGLFLVPQSVNLSRSDFDACDIVEEIRQRVDRAGFPHNLITIEITESIVGSDFDFIKAQVKRIRSLGFPVWMDDFGSGYSSLDVLQSMPVDLIKLDMRFMQQFNHGPRSRIILTELMKMAIGLGLDTVCEGVEHEDQMIFLREIGCSKMQGYLFTKPLPLSGILERYQTGTQIGFENPEESNYFDAIGRINLYDLAVIAQEEQDALQHYFNTVPMAIIEYRDGKVRFTRSNQAYRDFMQRMFHIALSELGDAFEQPPNQSGVPFVHKMHQCCQENGRAIFDETMPDGTVVHSFMRYIADNPVTHTAAVVVAVLAITGGPEKKGK